MYGLKWTCQGKKSVGAWCGAQGLTTLLGVLTLARKNHTASEVLLSDAPCVAVAAVVDPDYGAGANVAVLEGADTDVASAAEALSPYLEKEQDEIPAMGLSVLGGDASLIVRQHMPLVRQIARKYSQYAPDSFEGPRPGWLNRAAQGNPLLRSHQGSFGELPHSGYLLYTRRNPPLSA